MPTSFHYVIAHFRKNYREDRCCFGPSTFHAHIPVKLFPNKHGLLIINIIEAHAMRVLPPLVQTMRQCTNLMFSFVAITHLLVVLR